MTGNSVRPLLLPAAWLYGAAITLRNAAFDLRIFRSHDVGIPVISVGNVSAGGTGKTPLVEEIARMLLKKGVRTGVLSRGYGRDTVGFRWVRRGSALDADARQCGDEPVQMARNLKGAFVAVDEDRVEGARTMIADERIQALVLDDAFQHRWITRSFDVVVLTAADALGQGVLLPAGRLREPMSSLRRAHTIVVTGCWRDELCVKVRERLRPLTDVDIYYTYPVISGLRDLASDKFVDIRKVAGKRVLAVSGIGNPASFRESLDRTGVQVTTHLAYDDHHTFTKGDVDAIHREIRKETCEAVIMTQKDAVRLANDPVAASLRSVRVYAAVMNIEWIGGAGAFERQVTSIVVKRKDR